MLEKLSKFKNLDDAAKYYAGNWDKWSHFAWFGSDEYKDSLNIAICYVSGPNSSLVDDSNAVTIKKLIQPYLGMFEDSNKTADNFGASVSGDSNVLSGYLIRVFDSNNKITEIFTKLYELAQNYSDYEPLESEEFKKLNRIELLRYVGYALKDLCEELDIHYSESRILEVVVSLEECDVDADMVNDDDIISIICEEETAA